ncbi:MAG TPA: hypothetical protein VL172_03235 [Kofleriaceae bacterium]|nr:hypothetical protein [Kofleriaceae bacterium]
MIGLTWPGSFRSIDAPGRPTLMDKRPPAPVRYLVLCAALVCLVCAVCARGQQPAPAQPQPAAQVEPPAANPAANPAEASPDAGVVQPQAPEAQTPEAPNPPPKFFPATKAPGFLFR